jgi:hypothetical protein
MRRIATRGLGQQQSDMGTAKNIFFPKIRFTELVSRAGGVPRDLAVEAAQKSLESMRGPSDREIIKSIARMEAIVSAPADSGKFSPHQLGEILRAADQVVTLAGLFGYQDLDTAARSLCDVADGLVGAGMGDKAPVAVHVQALRLMAPSATPLPDANRAIILSELAKVVAHYNFGSLAATAPRDDELPGGGTDTAA